MILNERIWLKNLDYSSKQIYENYLMCVFFLLFYKHRNICAISLSLFKVLIFAFVTYVFKLWNEVFIFLSERGNITFRVNITIILSSRIYWLPDFLREWKFWRRKKLEPTKSPRTLNCGRILILKKMLFFWIKFLFGIIYIS